MNSFRSHAASRSQQSARVPVGATPRVTAIRTVSLLLLATLVQLAQPSSGFAGLIVSVSDLTLPAGGAGFADVHIRSDGSDLLGLYNVEFRISPVEFVDPQSDLQLADPDYVFAGNSFKDLNALPLGNVIPIFATGDTFAGFDFTADFTDIVLDGTDLLLARLEVTAATGLPPEPGDQFMVSLVENSVFLNDSGMLEINTDASDLTGTVTISAPSTAPEPASLTLFCLGAMGVAAAGRRPRRRTRRDHCRTGG
jgi:hypothetical protein